MYRNCLDVQKLRNQLNVFNFSLYYYDYYYDYTLIMCHVIANLKEK